MYLYDITNEAEWKLLLQFEGCSHNGFNTIRTEFSPDSELLVYRWNKEIRIMSTSTLEIVRVFKASSKWVNAVFSDDGAYLAV